MNPKLKLKSALPVYVHVNSFETMLIVATLLANEGRKIDLNVLPKDTQSVLSLARWCSNGTTLYISPGSVSRQQDGPPKKGCPCITSLDDAVALFYEQPIMIGEYVVTPGRDGVQVGCQFIPWEKVRAVAALESLVSEQ